MSRDLNQMTPEELGKIFPIMLSEYDTGWADLFEMEKEKIINAIGIQDIVRIEHIGSTSVAGLISKPTIDILLEIAEDSDNQKIIDDLKEIGYCCTLKPRNPPPHLMFMKGYTPEGFKGQAYHIHVRYHGDWDELHFRDYLRKNASVARHYGELKQILAVKFRNDREGYTDAKTDFIRKATQKARDAAAWLLYVEP